ncbi:hypothetical protein [Hongsoonwoonella zoysiae]|uniref:capsular polysaccharide export protein, LipB/KpsS family n=1 Tax=Hongsoonwoonella zoysiae TaxID=2821844 RepID=UPI0031B59C07
MGWGRKPSGLRADRIAARTGARVWRLEDGFLRSHGLGNHEPPLSIVVDDLGIYYDCNRPSRLERLISQQNTSSQDEEARRIATKWREARVSKYNCHPEFSGELPDDYVLVADQTRNDSSILYGAASAASFETMLNAAIHENPNSHVVVKTHPDVLDGKKSGYFSMDIAGRSRNILLIADRVHPVRLIERARKVYTVTSQIGFEALIWGKPVRTFGMPFYAGWGMTEDEISPPAERKRIDIEDLIHAALVGYPTYNSNTDVSRYLRPGYFIDIP